MYCKITVSFQDVLFSHTRVEPASSSFSITTLVSTWVADASELEDDEPRPCFTTFLFELDLWLNPESEKSSDSL